MIVAQELRERGPAFNLWCERAAVGNTQLRGTRRVARGCAGVGDPRGRARFDRARQPEPVDACAVGVRRRAAKLSESVHGRFRHHPTELDEVTAAGRELLRRSRREPTRRRHRVRRRAARWFLAAGSARRLESVELRCRTSTWIDRAAISIGDVAREGPRISLVLRSRVHSNMSTRDPRGGDLLDVTAIQLALFEHPDLQALFQFDIHGELATHSRWQLDEAMRLRAPLQSQQRSLADVDALWPSEPLTGNLAGRWEHVRAVPVLGGVVIEVLPIWLNVGNSVVSAELCGAEIGELKFVPNEALAAGADLVAARRPCTGLRPRDPGTKRYEAQPGHLTRWSLARGRSRQLWRRRRHLPIDPRGLGLPTPVGQQRRPATRQATHAEQRRKVRPGPPKFPAPF